MDDKQYILNRKLLDAVVDNNVEKTKGLIKMGADVNGRFPSRAHETALHLAATHGCLECMKILIENGADVNAQNTMGDYGGTPLMYSTYYGHNDCTKLLIDNGAVVWVERED